MKIFYCADIHAAETTFRKFTNASKFYGVDMVIYGGDFTGKMVVPIIKDQRGRYKCTYYGSTVVLKNGSELPDLEKTLRECGFYPVVFTEEEYDRLTESDADRITREQQIKVMEAWIKLADARFRKNNIPCVFIPGNDDDFFIDPILEKTDFMINGDNKVVEVKGYEILSLSYGHPTVFKYPRDISEEELSKKIDDLAAQVKNMSKCIFNIHVPPYDTYCDQDVQYDENLNPILDGGELATGPVGSKAVRQAIDKYQPLLSLHGHTHGSRGVSKIGRTLAINPGSDYDSGMLRGAIIEIDSGADVRYSLTSG
ncbi:metallophosphoesterase family protein [Candidatus Formimonas warabiya]|uniref:Uncharacterized protein n=1 Tax=Formimonas warabiya TaxID=1761012 RepID=A0A3G1KZ47_FORW1|nr:metallophosphoesterase [Candidatus Formimonas warabiya]ATW27786.1 hypothetical protein DCMF_26235 [Candidatus Formimonas warabiya]